MLRLYDPVLLLQLQNSGLDILMLWDVMKNLRSFILGVFGVCLLFQRSFFKHVSMPLSYTYELCTYWFLSFKQVPLHSDRLWTVFGVQNDLWLSSCYGTPFITNDSNIMHTIIDHAIHAEKLTLYQFNLFIDVKQRSGPFFKI